MAAQQRLFEAPRARLELYDLVADPWELRNLAGDPRYANDVRDLAGVPQKWMEDSQDFPAAYQVRDDNTDRITGVPFTTKISLVRNTDEPPLNERWAVRRPHRSPTGARPQPARMPLRPQRLPPEPGGERE